MIIRVVFIDQTTYECAITNKELASLVIQVNSTHVGTGHDEDYLSIKCGIMPLLIAPMREIKKYELAFEPSDYKTDVNKYKEWWDSKHATND